ncbi:hypothetical protein IPP75_04285 [Candidatus Saccharibacteria bacterium]|nr:MAG: hypothetical protein IPP75_04285 [Candidatus Saccharibacteria bacterium]
MMKLFYHLAADINYSPLPNSGATGDIAKESIPEILRIVFGISGSVALLIIVISGLRYILASGDPAKMAQAKKGILYAVIGLAIALSGYSIVTLVVRGLG